VFESSRQWKREKIVEREERTVVFFDTLTTPGSEETASFSIGPGNPTFVKLNLHKSRREEGF
jgi:hypothetical protein